MDQGTCVPGEALTPLGSADPRAPQRGRGWRAEPAAPSAPSRPKVWLVVGETDHTDRKHRKLGNSKLRPRGARSCKGKDQSPEVSDGFRSDALESWG